MKIVIHYALLILGFVGVSGYVKAAGSAPVAGPSVLYDQLPAYSAQAEQLPAYSEQLPAYSEQPGGAPIISTTPPPAYQSELYGAQTMSRSGEIGDELRRMQAEKLQVQAEMTRLQAATAAAAPAQRSSLQQKISGKVSDTWEKYKGAVGGEKAAIGIAATAGALAAAGTTAAIVGSIHHTQSIILDKSILKAHGRIFNVDLAYMTIPGLTFADHHRTFAIKIINDKNIVILEQVGGRDKPAASGSDITIARTGDTFAVNVKKGAWCIRAITVKERDSHNPEVSKEVPLLANRCKGHVFGLAKGQDGKLQLSIKSLEE